MKDKDVANIVLGQAGEEDRFTIKIFGIKLNLSIKPLRVKDLVEASKWLSEIAEIDENKAMFPSIIESSKDLRYIVKAITISTRTPLRWLVYRALMGLELKDIDTLFTIYKKQIDMERFFFILVSAKGLNSLKRAKEE